MRFILSRHILRLHFFFASLWSSCLQWHIWSNNGSACHWPFLWINQDSRIIIRAFKRFFWSAVTIAQPFRYTVSFCGVSISLWLCCDCDRTKHCISDAYFHPWEAARLTILISMWCLAIWKRLFKTYNFPDLSGFPLRQTSACLKPRLHSPCLCFVRKQTIGLLVFNRNYIFLSFHGHWQTDTTHSLRLGNYTHKPKNCWVSQKLCFLNYSDNSIEQISNNVGSGGLAFISVKTCCVVTFKGPVCWINCGLNTPSLNPPLLETQ